MRYNIDSEAGEVRLINDFNKRKSGAYDFVYNLYFNHLYAFSRRLFYDTEVDVTDLIHDIFVSLLENRETNFNTLIHLKGYLFLSIRNSHKRYILRKSTAARYNQSVSSEPDYLTSQMVEIEVISQVSMMINTLPEQCAEVLSLFVQGYDIKEIAEKLGKSHSTVYNQKNRGIEILKERFKNSPIIAIILSL